MSSDTPTRGKKSVKRKRSLSEKASPDATPTPKKLGRPKKNAESKTQITQTYYLKLKSLCKYVY